MDSLATLFGSAARVKLLRLFIFNQDAVFTIDEASERAKLPRDAVRKELAHLAAAGFLKRKTGKGRTISYALDQRFEHLAPLDLFIRETCVLRPNDVLSSLKKAGTLKLVVLSGFFTGVLESQVDLLIVGDEAFDERAASRAVGYLEAELGREIRYAFFPLADFRYRIGVYDRLLRDIFDYSHRTILDKIGMR